LNYGTISPGFHGWDLKSEANLKKNYNFEEKINYYKIDNIIVAKVEN